MEEFKIKVRDASKHYLEEFTDALLKSMLDEGMGSLGPILSIHGYLGVLDELDSFGETMDATKFEMDPDGSSVLITVVVGKGKYHSRSNLNQAARLFGVKA